jgi:hypothetical protein
MAACAPVTPWSLEQQENRDSALQSLCVSSIGSDVDPTIGVVTLSGNRHPLLLIHRASIASPIFALKGIEFTTSSLNPYGLGRFLSII